jgi:hypothetical protein
MNHAAPEILCLALGVLSQPSTAFCRRIIRGPPIDESDFRTQKSSKSVVLKPCRKFSQLKKTKLKATKGSACAYAIISRPVLRT